MDDLHAAMMPDGRRLHLRQGPIDLVIRADADSRVEEARALESAVERFRGLLQEIVDELPTLRRRARPGGTEPKGAVAARMLGAVLPHSAFEFITPMAAVAGAVADEILSTMTAAAGLRRAYVNNGGDIAIHLQPQEEYSVAVAGLDGALNGRFSVTGRSGNRGIATSGRGGRSHSLGIADSVTVVGASAAAADAAATLVANAVDLPCHPAIVRRPAEELDPDSDLGGRQVVVRTGQLERAEIERALSGGVNRAAAMRSAGLLDSAAILLHGVWCIVGENGSIRDSGHGDVKDAGT